MADLAADPAALTHPFIKDREALGEFLDSLADKVPTIERDVARLRRSPQDRTLIADLFRALHNIKGDAAICKVEMGVLVAHPIETLLSRLREGEIVFSDALAEVILLALDRLEMATETIAAGHSIEHLKLPALVDGLVSMKDGSEAQLPARAIAVIEAVTGFRPNLAAVAPKAKAPAHERGSTAEDLRFFRQLALQLDSLSPHFKGRSDRLLRLVLDTNAQAGMPVDPLQLEAAAYLHDVGMMFLPQAIWLKAERLSAEDQRAMRDHPRFAAGLLERIPGWETAARIVLQHHEMPDGGGYPGGLKEPDIVAGAKILAMADAFEAVTLKHSHRGQSRSLLRAIAEINACDNQFAPEWIDHFNAVIRKSIEQG
ncbi:MAG: HD domain-containing protein [Rhodocyclaceae bacterium]|jgi:HPt (histidine-containing phosphotransfer) domain-containing protein|nr:HD domain-containing protein [Rhodocyclaceae bacterium]